VPRWPRSRAVGLGLALFALGAMFVLVDVLPFFAGVTNRPLWLNLACLAAPAGLILAVTAAVREGRADQRRALDELG
jgi:uncharacterized membrane protein YhdT